MAKVVKLQERVDGFVNTVTGAGVENLDKSVHTSFAAGTNLSLNERVLTNLYRYDSQCSNIIDIMPDEAARAWIRFTCDDPEMKKAVDTYVGKLRMKEHFKQGGKWGRLYGGAAIILGLDDGQDSDQPVNLSRLRDIKFARVLDRHHLTPVAFYDDPNEANFGQPSLYAIHGIGRARGRDGKYMTVKVHRERMLLFHGKRLTERDYISNGYWHDSVMNALFEALKQFQFAFNSSAGLIYDFSVPVWKMKGLMQAIMTGKEDAVKSRVRAMTLVLSSIRAILLDADSDESYERKTTNVAGLPDLLKVHMEKWASDCRVPMTILMGQQAGKVAGAEQDNSSWNKRVLAWEEAEYEDPLNRLFELVFACSQGPTGGTEPENWSFEFQPLDKPSAKEQAEIDQLTATTDAARIQSGVVDPAEVAATRFGGEEYNGGSMIAIDLEAREPKEQPDGETNPDGPGTSDNEGAGTGEAEEGSEE